jgi:hypothetical protein
VGQRGQRGQRVYVRHNQWKHINTAGYIYQKVPELALIAPFMLLISYFNGLNDNGVRINESIDFAICDV